VGQPHRDDLGEQELSAILSSSPFASDREAVL
jgi:hypothetical protein